MATPASPSPWGGVVFRRLGEEIARGWPPGLTVLTVGAGTSLALAFGFVGTWRQLSRTTAASLRNE